MTIRRLLTSLASHPPSPPSTSAPAVSRLIPPYHHTHNPATPPTLRPPYSYSASHPQALPSGQNGKGRTLKARVNYEVVKQQQQEVGVDGWTAWAEGVLTDETKRAEVERLWAETLVGLENVKVSGNQIPQITFHSLASHLSSPSTIDAIRQTGSVVIRDVVPDAQAINWAKEVLQGIEDVDGRSIYWHPALLSARADPSIISATAQISRSLLPTEEIYLKADTVREGLSPLPTRLAPASNGNPWGADRALGASLALTPTLGAAAAGGMGLEMRVPPTVHAATYTLLRPLFRPHKSKISFYNANDYLKADNWFLSSPSSTSISSLPGHDLPHLKGTEVSLPPLFPGDLILHHTALPFFPSSPLAQAQASGQIFLPLNPVEKLAKGSTEWVTKQREAFEHGLPPPDASASFVVDGEGLSVKEAMGEKTDIPSRAGREVMGY
ncbi:hypothetical protein L198_00081 [Cryptococcus wingfieldii CBS 7118]|uniref:Uncharacterized protein n=1 Tax=Cryptococcus wingfieldii CBS 7118 TaxID=1295528 RepID=A0A1E3K5Z4_9TREE|nr:hypothetical protein L198_00081 [Cryptococcus wingfieldii CBS 7118]ODO08356.1 hypothetical protein L198_00081 [Cryptococcus wingfieldii CBS 7118]